MKLLTLFLSLFIGVQVFSQEEMDSISKQNPILFAEIAIGYSNGAVKGNTGVFTLNYQEGKHLFSYRFLEIVEYDYAGSFLFIPEYVLIDQVRENSLLYGRRIIDGNTSYSYSAGIGVVSRKFLADETSEVQIYNSDVFVSFPFELNIKWFNSKKMKYRIYELIPIGQPTSFANSIGFKFFGNVSKKSFIGIGLTIGLGWHKIY